MAYYRSNAIYDALNSLGNAHPFRWATGNAWVLIYGDAAAQPVLLVLALGTSCNRPPALFDLVQKLANLTRLPAIAVEFDDGAPDITNVRLWPNIHQAENAAQSLHDLRNTFANFGLPVTSGAVAKAINDQASSAFHNWQRSALGNNICVSDLDLFRFRDDVIIEVLELKRSFYALDAWNPYPVDFKNFSLVSNLLQRGGILFHIIYNVRAKSPFRDDASRIAVFSFDSAASRTARIGICSFADFVNGAYIP